ncbi:MAG: HNH endonuclease [Patescibacteria group bacterium]|nr:HNH endonuclease [Patescibacteria group bacterium]
MKRSALKPSDKPLKRTGRLNPMSAKRRAQAKSRAEIREAVFARDKVCQWPVSYGGQFGFALCASKCFGPLTPHHLLKASQGGQYSMENLVALCARHNQEVEDHPMMARALGLVKRREVTSE